MRHYVRLAEVPEAAIQKLYDPAWATDVVKAIGGDEDVSPKTSQYLFKTVWNAVIQLMDKALMSMHKVDTTEFSKDPTFMQALAGLAYFVTDDGLRTALGVKSDSLQKAKGHVEALMSVIGKEADVDQTLQGLKKQAAPLIKKAFDGIVAFLKKEMPDAPQKATDDEPQAEQKAASTKTRKANDSFVSPSEMSMAFSKAIRPEFSRKAGDRFSVSGPVGSSGGAFRVNINVVGDYTADGLADQLTDLVLLHVPTTRVDHQHGGGRELESGGTASYRTLVTDHGYPIKIRTHSYADDPDTIHGEVNFMTSRRKGKQYKNRHDASTKTALHDLGGKLKPAVKRRVHDGLAQYAEWFVPYASYIYELEYRQTVNNWIQSIVDAIHWAEQSGTGDVSPVDHDDVKRDVAKALAVVAPGGITEKEIHDDLEILWDDILWDDGLVALAQQDIQHGQHNARAAAVRSSAAWSDLPDDWTKKSVQKFWDGLTGDRKHKIKACMKKMEGKVDDPGAFCGSLAKKLKVATTQPQKDTDMKIKYKGAEYVEAQDRDARAPAMQMTQQQYKSPAKQKPTGQKPAKQKKQKPKVDSKVKQFFKKLFNFPADDKAQQEEAVWGERVSSWGRIAATQKAAAQKGCGCGQRKRTSDNKVQLPTKCVEQIIGAKFTDQDVTTFEKKKDNWFVQGVDSNGVVDDTLVKSLTSYCEMLTTAKVRKAKMRRQAETSFYGTEIETFYVASDGTVWVIQNSDNAPSGFSIATLPNRAVPLSYNILDQQMIDDAEAIEQRITRGAGIIRRQAAALYCYETGDVIADGLQGSVMSDEAIQTAEHEAARRGTPVLLVDDDGEYVVYPDGHMEQHDAIDETPAYDGDYGSGDDRWPAYAKTRKAKTMRRKAETFRGFNLDVIPGIVKECLNEILADPDNYFNHDNGYEYWAETIMSASGRPEDYADALNIDREDPEWIEAVEGGWDFDHIMSVQDEVDGKIREVMQQQNLPGVLYLGNHEGDGSYGLAYFIDQDELEGMMEDDAAPLPAQHGPY